MQINTKTLDNARVKLDITLDEEDMQPYLDQIADWFFKNINVEGVLEDTIWVWAFNDGVIIQKQIQKENLEEEMIDMAINESYRSALRKENLTFSGSPEINIKNKPRIGGIKKENRIIDGNFSLVSTFYLKQRILKENGLIYSAVISIS